MKWKIKQPKRFNREWHVWFAWYPKEINGKFVWLERVWRKFDGFDRAGDLTHSYQLYERKQRE